MITFFSERTNKWYKQEGFGTNLQQELRKQHQLKLTIRTQTPVLLLETNIKQLGGELIDTDAHSKQKRKESQRGTPTSGAAIKSSWSERSLARIKQAAKRGGGGVAAEAPPSSRKRSRGCAGRPLSRPCVAGPQRRPPRSTSRAAGPSSATTTERRGGLSLFKKKIIDYLTETYYTQLRKGQTVG